MHPVSSSTNEGRLAVTQSLRAIYVLQGGGAGRGWGRRGRGTGGPGPDDTGRLRLGLCLG